MQNDFDTWNKRKKTVSQNNFLGFVHEREIWWCSLGVNIGHEQDGKHKDFERPVLIIKKFNNGTSLIAPITSKKKEAIYYHRLNHPKQNFIVILSQIRLVSTKRFRRHICRISIGEFALIKNKLFSLMNLDNTKPPA